MFIFSGNSVYVKGTGYLANGSYSSFTGFLMKSHDLILEESGSGSLEESGSGSLEESGSASLEESGSASLEESGSAISP